MARRQRAVYSDAQLFVLEQHFEMSQYPAAHTREELAQKLSVSVERVEVWFKNRRAQGYLLLHESSVPVISPYNVDAGTSLLLCLSF